MVTASKPDGGEESGLPEILGGVHLGVGDLDSHRVGDSHLALRDSRLSLRWAGLVLAREQPG